MMLMQLKWRMNFDYICYISVIILYYSRLLNNCLQQRDWETGYVYVILLSLRMNATGASSILICEAPLYLTWSTGGWNCHRLCIIMFLRYVIEVWQCHQGGSDPSRAGTITSWLFAKQKQPNTLLFRKKYNVFHPCCEDSSGCGVEYT